MITIKLTDKDARMLYRKLQYKQNPAYLPLLNELIKELRLHHCPKCGQQLPNETILKMEDAPIFLPCEDCGHKHTRECPAPGCPCGITLIPPSVVVINKTSVTKQKKGGKKRANKKRS